MSITAFLKRCMFRFRRLFKRAYPYFQFVSYATEKQKTAGLPERQTQLAAGYDFAAPEDVTLHPGETVLFDTGIKAHMPNDVVLLLFPRSSMGIRRGIVLANGTGIIDADYADNEDNEGAIRAALLNRSDEPLTIQAGERYMQGVFVRFAAGPGGRARKRRGGIGSTDRIGESA